MVALAMNVMNKRTNEWLKLCGNRDGYRTEAMSERSATK